MERKRKKEMHAVVFGSILYLMVVVAALSLHHQRPRKLTRTFMLSMGVVGQVMVLFVAYAIFRTSSLRLSIHMYICLYMMHLVSLSLLDMEMFTQNPKNFSGRIHDHNTWTIFADFFYLNASIVSTIGFGDILAVSLTARMYTVYKILMTIFICAFLLNDIIVKPTMIIHQHHHHLLHQKKKKNSPAH